MTGVYGQWTHRARAASHRRNLADNCQPDEEEHEMKDRVYVAASLLIAPTLAFAYCTAVMVTGNPQVDQARWDAYRQCNDQEQQMRQMQQDLEQMKSQQRDLQRRQRTYGEEPVPSYINNGLSEYFWRQQQRERMERQR